MTEGQTENTKIKVAETAKAVYEAGLVMSTWGNVSARIIGKNQVAITPSGLSKGHLKPEDIVVIDMEGKVVEGILKPSSETPLHLSIYKNRPDVNAILHTHSTFATSFAITGVEIPVVTEDLALVNGGSVSVSRYAPLGSEELAEAAIKALGRKNAVLLQSHGVIAVGPSLGEALRAAIVVEHTAKVFVISKFIGNPIKIGDEQVAKLRKLFLNKYPKSK